MSYPPGPPDPNQPGDPWSTPSGDAGQPSYPPQQPPQQPYGQPYPPQPDYGYGQPPYAPPTNGKAQASLWTGIGLLVLGCCGLGLFGFVPVILGVKARNEIRASNGQQEGDGMALAGIVTGAIAILLSVLMIVLVVVLVAAGSRGFETGYTETLA